MAVQRSSADVRALERFGQRVRSCREELGLSQEGLAELAEFDRTYISMIERGKRNPSLLNIRRFARSLRTSPEALVKGL